jgi:hypothetical protein
MTQDQKDVLAHVVIDADAWDAHQRAHFIQKHGEKEGTRIANANLLAKVKRIREKTDFLRVKDAPEYKNRIARDADEKLREDAEIAAQLETIRQQKEQQDAAFDSAVRAKVEEILKQRG